MSDAVAVAMVFSYSLVWVRYDVGVLSYEDTVEVPCGLYSVIQLMGKTEVDVLLVVVVPSR